MLVFIGVASMGLCQVPALTASVTASLRHESVTTSQQEVSSQGSKNDPPCHCVCPGEHGNRQHGASSLHMAWHGWHGASALRRTLSGAGSTHPSLTAASHPARHYAHCQPTQPLAQTCTAPYSLPACTRARYNAANRPAPHCTWHGTTLHVFDAYLQGTSTWAHQPTGHINMGSMWRRGWGMAAGDL